jgi:hypothetical protein
MNKNNNIAAENKKNYSLANTGIKKSAAVEH